MASIDRARLRELHAAGLTDREKAAALGCSAAGVKAARAALGLRGHGTRAPSARERQAVNLRAQLAARGVSTLRRLNPDGPRRKAAAADLAARYGLPADLFPAQVRILLALAGGPLTTARLVAATGRRPRGSEGQAYQCFNCPTCPGGNYLKDLRGRGLVAFTGGRSRGPGRRDPGHNLLTAAAMDLLTKGEGP